MAAAYRTQHQLEGVLCERFGQVCTASASRGMQLGSLHMGTIYSLCYVTNAYICHQECCSMHPSSGTGHYLKKSCRLITKSFTASLVHTCKICVNIACSVSRSRQRHTFHLRCKQLSGCLPVLCVFKRDLGLHISSLVLHRAQRQHAPGHAAHHGEPRGFCGAIGHGGGHSCLQRQQQCLHEPHGGHIG